MEKGFCKITVTLNDGKTYECLRKITRNTKSPRIFIQFNGQEAEINYNKNSATDIEFQTKYLLGTLIKNYASLS